MAIFRRFNRRQKICHGESAICASAFGVEAVVSIFYFKRILGSLHASKMSAMKFPMTKSAVAITTQSTTR